MIETRKLTKRYGNLIAANEIDLKLEEGDVFGFIGPNGSGKTTTMRMIATLLNPDYGEAYVCGKSIYTDPQEIRRLVGYMPDFFGVYDDMTVIEYLEFFAVRLPHQRHQAAAKSAKRSSNWSTWPSSAMRWSTSCRAARRSGSAWPARCCTSRKSCCSTNRPAVSTRGPASRSATCSSGWAN